MRNHLLLICMEAALVDLSGIMLANIILTEGGQRLYFHSEVGKRLNDRNGDSFEHSIIKRFCYKK